MRERASEKDAASSYLQKVPALRDVGMLEEFVEDERDTTFAVIERPTGKADVVFEGRVTKVAAIGYEKSSNEKEKQEKIDECLQCKKRGARGCCTKNG